MIQINKENAKRIAIIVAPIVAVIIVSIIIIRTVVPSIDTSLEIPEHEDDGQLVPFGDVRQLSVFVGDSADTALTHIESAITTMSDAYEKSDNKIFAVANIAAGSFKRLSEIQPKVCSFDLELDNGVKYNIWVRVEDSSESVVTTVVKDPSGDFYVYSSTDDSGKLTDIKTWLEDTIHVVPEIHFMEDDFDVESLPGFDDTKDDDYDYSYDDESEEY